LGLTQDASSSLLQEEKYKYCALVLSGVFEVLLNMVATEMQKVNDAKRVDYEKELIELVDAYTSLAKYKCTSKLGNGMRRGIIGSSAKGTPDDFDASNTKFSLEKTPFLATSSIYQILQTAMKLYKSDCSTDIPASEDHNQLPSTKALSCCSKIFSFVLSASFLQIKSFLSVGNDDPLKALIYGDIKVLGPLLLKLVWLLISGLKFGKDQKKNEVKVRKHVEDSKEHAHIALACLKELIVISLLGPDHTGLIEDLVSVSLPEHESNKLDVGWEDDCREDFGIDDSHTRSKELFIKKCIKPLLSELLSLSFLREVEVNASSHFIHSLFLLNNICF